MRLRLILISTTAALGLSACDGGAQATPGVPAPAAESHTNIVIKNFAYTPGVVRVHVGTTVTWTNADSTAHTTTADKVGAETWDSGNVNPNHSYSIVVTAPGTYSFHCSIHNYMTGVITVVGG